MTAIRCEPAPALRRADIIDDLMNALPARERRWCGNPGCECSGCANGVMSREEWMAWFIRQKNARCDQCRDAVRLVGRDGRTYLACETCDTVWT